MGTLLMEWSKYITIDYPVKLTGNIKSTHKLEFNIKCVSFEIIPENHEKKLNFFYQIFIISNIAISQIAGANTKISCYKY